MFDSTLLRADVLAGAFAFGAAAFGAVTAFLKLMERLMIEHAAAHDLLTLGQVGKELGITAKQVQSLFAQGLLPPAQRVGRYRVVPRSDLPKVRSAAVRAGYLKE